MGRIERIRDRHFEGGTMNRIILYFTDAEIKLLDKVHKKTGLSYHDLILRTVRAYERNA